MTLFYKEKFEETIQLISLYFSQSKAIFCRWLTTSCLFDNSIQNRDYYAK